MKRLALVAAVLVLAACAKKEAPVDTAAPAMAPAPTAADSMRMDSMRLDSIRLDSIKMDSMKKDSIAAAAKAKKKG